MPRSDKGHAGFKETVELPPHAVAARPFRRKVQFLEVMASAIVGGMETYVMNLIRLLPSDEFQVMVVCPFESPVTATLRDMGCSVFIARMDDDPPWRSIQTVVEVVRNYQVDLIHAHMPKAHVLAGISGALTRVPALATVHGNTITTHELGICRTTETSLIVVCQEAYMQALAMGVPPDRVTLISNGADLERFKPTGGETFRQSLNLPTGAPLIGFVGRLDVEKGPDQFLQAAQYIHREVPQAHFVMVGAGTQYDRIAEERQNLQLEQVVHLAGLWTDTSKVFPALDLLLHTSRIEGMPLTVLEAMACGRPVVAIGVGGVPEVVEEGTTGLIAGPGDWRGVATRAIDLLEHPDRLSGMGEAARRRAERHFDLRVSVQQTASLFKQKVKVAP